eukprot:scaffold44993_cov33-Attheya_sp.AAC.3
MIGEKEREAETELNLIPPPMIREKGGEEEEGMPNLISPPMREDEKEREGGRGGRRAKFNITTDERGGERDRNIAKFNSTTDDRRGGWRGGRRAKLNVTTDERGEERGRNRAKFNFITNDPRAMKKKTSLPSKTRITRPPPRNKVSTENARTPFAPLLSNAPRDSQSQQKDAVEALLLLQLSIVSANSSPQVGLTQEPTPPHIRPLLMVQRTAPASRSMATLPSEPMAVSHLTAPMALLKKERAMKKTLPLLQVSSRKTRIHALHFMNQMKKIQIQMMTMNLRKNTIPCRRR